MTYRATWGYDGQQTVNSATELDTLLDRLEHERGEEGDPLAVAIIDLDADPELRPGLDLGLGHPNRSFLFYSGTTATETGYAADPALPAWDTDIYWDRGGSPDPHEPARTRIRPEQAREAARQYVTTGRRPTTVTWNAETHTG